MALPRSNFYFENKTLLKIQCRDLSNGSSTPPVTAWAWNFGDGNSATTQNPEHIYAAPGIYLLSLTVTSLDGTSIKSTYLTLDDDKFIITLPIIELIRYKIPSTIFDYLNIVNLIQKWQLMLQPQINPIAISDADVYDETKWPSLANSLIADLCVFDLLMSELDKLVGSSGAVTPISSGYSGLGSTPSLNGNIKIMEQGPAKTEWFNQQEASAGYFKAVMANSSSFLPEFKNRLCMTATRLRITLPFCKPEYINFLFKKSGYAMTPTFRLSDYYPALKLYEQHNNF